MTQTASPLPADAVLRHTIPNDEALDDEVKPLTREEAAALLRRLPRMSPWRVIGVQAVVGFVCVAVVGLVTQSTGSVLSALYGAGTVVLPQMVLARGLARAGRAGPVAAAWGFFVWEITKIAVAVALLAVAAKVVPGLSWPLLLVTMVLCMKANWLALIQRRTQTEKN